MARIGDQFVALSLCQDAKKRPQKTSQPARRHVPKPGESRWMDRFRVQGNEAWAAYRRDQAAAVSTLPRAPSGAPPQLETGYGVGTFYFAVFRNFLFCVDTCYVLGNPALH